MEMKKSENLTSWVNIAIAAIPIVWAFVEFYSRQNVLAENVRTLQNEREYIRDKLDHIVTKLSMIDGRIKERLGDK
jgi:hypothetical protein